jgi:thiol:disulfide interchange protein DsbC
MNRFKLLFTLIFPLFVMGQAHAQTASDIKAKLLERYARIINDSAEVEPTPLKDVWAVIQGGEVLYVSSDMNVLIQGEMFAFNGSGQPTRVSESLKAKHTREARIDVADIPSDAGIRFGVGGSRRLWVFSDPNCPYCKKLEIELSKLLDVELYIMPIALLNGSKELVRSIMCAKLPSAAWRNQMLHGFAPKAAPANCKPDVQVVQAFAQRWRINATPTILFEDGFPLQGAVSQERIEAELKLRSKGGNR